MPIVDRTSAALARVADLEKKLEHVEKDAEWDALGPEIADVERALHAQIDADKKQVEAQRSQFSRGHGVFARWFNGNARSEYDSTVVATEKDLAKAQEGELKLHQLKSRFFDDKMRVHAREFIRVASKVQKNVPGSWQDKALAAAGRWLTGATGDEAVDFVKAFRAALSVSADSETVLAAQLALASPKDAAQLTAQLGWKSTADLLVVAAAVHANKSAADVAAAVGALSATGVMPKGEDARALLGAAALLAKGPLSSSAALVSAMSGKVNGMWDGAEPVIAAALLQGIDASKAIDFANRAVKLLSGAEGSASIIAAGLIAGRSVEDTVATAKEIEGAVAGTLQARAAIAAAGVLSGRPAGEVIAFAKHVQSQLSGTWESEATIICAGILGNPGKAAGDHVRRAFVLRGLVRPADDE